MNDTLLNRVNTPADLKRLSRGELDRYCAEARAFLLNTVSRTGGHLASSLGVVELTVALHRVFDSPTDKIIWDVGHQAYVHKLITGRRDRFDTLRQENGISGFTRSAESEHDPFISGHSSTSISAAIGMARASKLRGENNYTIAVIGDGAFTGGLAYEALNNAEDLDHLIVVLNHNTMSISKNVGSFARYLSLVRSKPGYLRLKTNLTNLLDKTPLVGKGVKSTLQTGKSILRKVILHATFFEDLGFTYMGPVDGHNLDMLMSTLSYARRAKGPVFMLVDTIKGKGYSYAEQNPGAYHGVSSFNPEDGNPDLAPADSFSTVAGKTLCALAERDPRICAVTAAMKYGTGLQFFAAKHRPRFFDVGIAEAHAVTFCAGLAAKGMLPVFAVYSTFLQRSFDQILHDASIEPRHLVLLVDRAGVVGGDGETHQGLFDTAFLNLIPNLVVYAPADYHELKLAIEQALYRHDGVVAVRYPRGAEVKSAALSPEKTLSDYRLFGAPQGDRLLVTYGRLFHNAIRAQKTLEREGISVSVLKLNRITCLADSVFEAASAFSQIDFYEEGIQQGGVAETFAAELLRRGYAGRFRMHAVDNRFVPQATVERSLETLHLDAASMVRELKGASELGE